MVPPRKQIDGTNERQSMNVHLRTLTLAAGGLLAASLTATATPLQRADLPANPTWAVHIDVDKMLTTGVGQFLQGEMSKPDAAAKLAAFQAVVGFDLQKQLHGLTLYGTTPKPEDGVLMVYSDFDADRLVTLAKAAEDYQSATYGSRVIHSWIDANKPAKDGVRPRTYAALVGLRVVFGQRQAAVAAAIDVLDGHAPNLGGSATFPQLGSNAGVLQAAASHMDLPDTDPNAAILRLSKLMSLEVGEAQGNATSTLTLQANTDEIAQQITSIAQGLVALGKLQTGNPDATKLANATTVKQDGSTVTISTTLPTADVVAAMKAAAAKHAANP